MAHRFDPLDASKHAIEGVAAEAGKHLDDFIKAASKEAMPSKDLLDAGASILSIVPQFIHAVGTEMASFGHTVDVFSKRLDKILAHLNDNPMLWSWGRFEKMTWKALSGEVNELGRDFIEWFIGQSLGVNLGESTGGIIKQQFTSGTGDDAVTSERVVDASGAINTLNHLSSFLIELPFLTAAINIVGGVILGERWKETGGEYLTKFTEELGLSWMTGTLLEQVFEQAVGRELEELINVQKHPNRLDMMTLRTLAKQHKIEHSEFEWELSKLGFPPEIRQLILQLDTNQLPIGDIANAWIMGYRDPEWVDDYLRKQGYSDEDVDVLKFNYITHASTQAESIYRDTARLLFTEHKINEKQFRDILVIAQTPAKSIDIEVANINLQKDYGRKSLTISEIKKAWDGNQFSDEEATAHLIVYGYSEDDAGILITEWKTNTTTKPRLLSASQVLRYMVSGHIDPIAAYQKLIELRYRPDDAKFLIANPTAQSGTKALPLNKSTVLAAHEDGIIDQPKTVDLLHQINVAPDEANLLIQISNYKIARRKKTLAPVKLLSSGDIKAAFKVGQFTQPEAQHKLEEVGYSTEDAHLLSMTWWYETHEAPLGGGLPPGTVPPSIWEPSPTSPPAPTGDFTAIYLTANKKLYRVYPQLFNPVKPPNSNIYTDSANNIYYILIGDDVPPGFKVHIVAIPP